MPVLFKKNILLSPLRADAQLKKARWEDDNLTTFPNVPQLWPETNSQLMTSAGCKKTFSFSKPSKCSIQTMKYPNIDWGHSVPGPGWTASHLISDICTVFWSSSSTLPRDLRFLAYFSHVNVSDAQLIVIWDQDNGSKKQIKISITHMKKYFPPKPEN